MGEIRVRLGQSGVRFEFTDVRFGSAGVIKGSGECQIWSEMIFDQACKLKFRLKELTYCLCSAAASAVQGSTKWRALSCEKFLSGPVWLLLSKTGPPFSGALYDLRAAWLVWAEQKQKMRSLNLHFS